MKIPGRTVSFILSIFALCTFAFPILSLPCSITGLFQSISAKKFISQNELSKDGLVTAAFWMNISAISITALIMLLAIPGAIQNNL
jgi:hypothetical protein